MDCVEVDPGLAGRFAAQQLDRPRRFNACISPEDEMYLHALQGYGGNVERAALTYLLQGKQMLEEVEQVVRWAFGGWGSVSAFLDFACGHGRFTRHLVQELDPGRVWASDIYEDAVRFQREQFRVNAVASSMEPEDFAPSRRFDLVFVSSLFSHLPSVSFHRWLETLYSLLEKEGVLIFTTHGIGFSGQQEEEFIFRPESESRSLDVNAYGMAFASADFVERAIEKVVGAEASWHCFPHGHLGFQDLYVVRRGTSAGLPALVYDPGFFGHLGGCWMGGDGTLHLRGWAADLGSGQPVRVRILEGDRLIRECWPDHDRRDVAQRLGSDRALRSGWSCPIPAAQIPGEEWIAIKIVNRDDREQLISLGRLQSMLGWFPPAQ